MAKRNKRTGVAVERGSAQPNRRPPVHGISFVGRWWPLALLVGATFLVYSRTMGFGFTDWDDDTNVYRNPGVLMPSWEALGAFWRRPYADLYVPLVYTTFWLEAHLGALVAGGLVPALHHATNVLVHAASVVAVWRLLRARMGSGAALFGALVFALHPIQVEAVAWVTGRKDVLSGCLVLWSLERFDHFWRRGTRGGYAAASALFLLALAAKPAAVVTPLLAAGVMVSPRREWRRAAVWLAPWLVASMIWTLMTRASQTAISPDSDFWVPLWMRPFGAADALLFYVKQIVWPTGLTPLYLHSNREIFRSAATWWAPLAVGAAAAAIAWRGRWAGRAAWWFAVPLLPVLGFVPFIYQYHANVADRYAYVAMLGVGLAAGQAYAWSEARADARWRRWTVAGAGALVVGLGVLAMLQSTAWRSSEDLWARVLQFDPGNSHALFNLASGRARQGDDAAALELFERIVKEEPGYGRAYPNLLQLAARLGRSADVERYGQMALELRPGNVDNYLARGHALLLMRDSVRAEAEFRGAVFGLPTDPEGHLYLGVALIGQGRLEEAEGSLREAMRLNEAYAPAHATLGLVFAQQGRRDEAIRELEAAVVLEPRDERSRRALEELRGGAGPGLQ